jgi:hypothetical protein
MSQSWKRGIISSSRITTSPIALPFNYPPIRHCCSVALKTFDRSRFSKGGGFIISTRNWDKYPAKSGFVGRIDATDSGQFVAPLGDLKEVIQGSKTHLDIEKSLGVEPGSLSGDCLLVTLFEPIGLREAKANSPGANSKFLGTGQTPGGGAEGFVSLIDLQTVFVGSDGDISVYKNVGIHRIRPGDHVDERAYTGLLAGNPSTQL